MGDPQVTHNSQGGATSMHPRISCTNFCSSLALLLSRDETVKRIEKYELLKAWITEHIIHTNTHQSYMMHYDAMMRLHCHTIVNGMNLGAFGLNFKGPRLCWQALGQESCAGASQLHHQHLAQHNLHHLSRLALRQLPWTTKGGS